ncbi:hypothetical protein CFP65_6119 [Kitasatospora sp. MMS16-BH015]|uniref:C45 family autoproteolytic acyltransferase/hydolase n=1 Tax=Kitasatospora sp. MMS16-BH015 TaxID=2018025 RepID=UPI000CA301EE|nr:C45 family peptidase [Kitasatospora sp. MMS16-BH015]AUG80787.1 hypothetical protein CFP65_6119 [Kitasatospora sp. MMS16-BH015]
MLAELEFHAVEAGDGTDGRWAATAQARWPEAERWLAAESRTPAGAAAGRALFARHMPELLPQLDRLAEQLDRPGGAELLTHTGLRPFFANCSQTAVAGQLLRTYDFDPRYACRTVLSSTFLRPVIGMSELLWGLLDGMNDAGLAVSLTFGGRTEHGRGFSVMMIVRYLLETCASVAEAVKALERLPAATVQNLTLVDGEQALTVHIGPDIPATPVAEICTTNHQHGRVNEATERFTQTRARLTALRAARAEPGDDPVATVLAALARRPLYRTQYDQGFGTLYTAAYRPAEGSVSYLWPQDAWHQSFARFRPGSRTVRVGL